MLDIFSRTVVGARARMALADSQQNSPLPTLTMSHEMTLEAFIDLVRRSGLAGKGGASYPMYRKLVLMAQQPPERRCVVINGSEHEPGSDKDRYLLERYPETVLEGALIVAHALGADHLIFSVTETADRAAAALQTAIDRYAPDIPRAIQVEIVPVQAAYLVGEESALLATLEGKPALPRGKPPFPIESGLYGVPTLIQNVETVAHLPFIIAAGVDEYLSLGSGGRAVTLCTFGSEFNNAGVRLVPLGISVRELIEKFGGGLRSGQSIKAIQPGGPGTGFVSHEQLDVAYSNEALKEIGSAVGCGAIRAFSQDEDMLEVLTQIMEFFAAESCGQCPGCRMETQMLANIMRQARAGRGSEKLLRQIPLIIKNAHAKPALCGLVKMPAPPILTALELFADELSRTVVTTSNV
jgi:NADH:ubiquinone oxidoreductase subunit F (NADH-binding)